MARAEKRQRKKDNARQAREAREAAIKRKRQMRNFRNAAIAVGVFAIVVILIVVAGKSGKSNKKASTTTTTVASTTTTAKVNIPAGCDVAKKPPASDASIKRTYSAAPAMQIDPAKTYTATMSTSCGDIVISLDAKAAPKGVNNFVFLAKNHFYDGLTWHRIVKDFVIQGGDPKGDGTGGPGYSTPTETPANGYKDGMLAYAKTGSDPAGTAGSQFFVITGKSIDALNQKVGGKYQYGVFGQVTKGLDVAQKLASFAPANDPNGQGTPTRTLYIFKVTIAES